VQSLAERKPLCNNQTWARTGASWKYIYRERGFDLVQVRAASSPVPARPIRHPHITWQRGSCPYIISLIRNWKKRKENY
jgi:hypothetical protein